MFTFEDRSSLQMIASGSGVWEADARALGRSVLLLAARFDEVVRTLELAEGRLRTIAERLLDLETMMHPLAPAAAGGPVDDPSATCSSCGFMLRSPAGVKCGYPAGHPSRADG